MYVKCCRPLLVCDMLWGAPSKWELGFLHFTPRTWLRVQTTVRMHTRYQIQGCIYPWWRVSTLCLVQVRVKLGYGIMEWNLDRVCTLSRSTLKCVCPLKRLGIKIRTPPPGRKKFKRHASHGNLLRQRSSNRAAASSLTQSVPLFHHFSLPYWLEHKPARR